MNVRQAPIGVFDSGLGGLSVLRELRALLPAEDVLYYADCAHCPYGGRRRAAIIDRSLAVAGALVDRGAKLLVVACNNATSVALGPLRATFPRTPIVGMVPAVKPAAAATRSGRIAVLATPRTVASELLAALIRDHAAGARVLLLPAPGLVEIVEAGELRGPRVEAALRPLLARVQTHDADTLVLGCTHYPFLSDSIRRLAGPDVALIDSGAAVARRTRAVLEAQALAATTAGAGTLTLLTSGRANHVAGVASRLLLAPVAATHLPA